MIQTLLFLELPPGPDICHLLGVCPSTASGTSGSNMLYLATALLLAGVLMQRTSKRR